MPATGAPNRDAHRPPKMAVRRPSTGVRPLAMPRPIDSASDTTATCQLQWQQSTASRYALVARQSEKLKLQGTA